VSEKPLFYRLSTLPASPLKSVRVVATFCLALASRMRSIDFRIKKRALPVSGNSAERTRMKRRRIKRRKATPRRDWYDCLTLALLIADVVHSFWGH